MRGGEAGVRGGRGKERPGGWVEAAWKRGDNGAEQWVT